MAKFFKKLKKGVKKVAKVAVPVGLGVLGGRALAGAFGSSVPEESSDASGSSIGDAIGSVWGAVSKHLPAISSAAGAIAPFYSGWQAGESAEEANKWNMEASERQMDYGREMAGRQEAFQRESVAGQQAFNSAQAANQMAFQERMANTARQREVADLQSAGLNPMMAHMSGAQAPMGASAASSAAGGASAGGSQLPPYESPGQKRLSSAMAAAQVVSMLKRAEAETDKLKSEAERNRAEVPVMASQESKNRVETRILTDRLNDHMPIERALAIAQLTVQYSEDAVKRSQYDVNLETQLNLQMQRHHLKAVIDEIATKMKLNDAERRLLEAEYPKALAAAKEYEGWLGKASPYIGEIGRAINSAGSASWVYRNMRR